VPQYPGLLHIPKLFDILKNGTWAGTEIRGIIRTLEGIWAPILVFSKDDGKTAAETASNEIVMGIVRTCCEFSLLVSEQNHSDLSLKQLYNALTLFYQKNGIFGE